VGNRNRSLYGSPRTNSRMGYFSVGTTSYRRVAGSASRVPYTYGHTSRPRSSTHRGTVGGW
jgi:hypothetical protein